MILITLSSEDIAFLEHGDRVTVAIPLDVIMVREPKSTLNAFRSYQMLMGNISKREMFLTLKKFPAPPKQFVDEGEGI